MEKRVKQFFNRFLPITEWLPAYRHQWLPRDIIAGLTSWALLVPGALAVAVIAGVPVQYGLYAAPLALVAYAIFGTSRQLLVGPSSTVAAMSAAVVTPLVLDGGPERHLALTIALALVVGVFLVAGGIARFGFIARFFAKPVLDGFITGLALFIAVGQLGKLFGVEASGSNTIAQVIDLFRQAGAWSWTTLAVGASCLLLLFVFSEFTPKLVPGALIVMILALVLATVLSLGDHGVKLVGNLPKGFPTWSLKGITLEDIRQLIPGALGLVVVAYAESIAVAKSYAEKYKYKVDPNQEMIAYGMANLGAGIFQGYAVNGSLSKTAANDEAGAKTPLALVISAVFTLFTILFLTPLFRNLPYAVLAAVVIQAVSGAIRVKPFKRYFKVMKADFVLSIAAFLGVLLLGILEGILIGIVLSLAAFIHRTSSPRSAVLGVDKSGIRFANLDEHEGYKRPLGDVIIYRFDAPLIFANIDVFIEEIKDLVKGSDPDPKAVIVDCEMMYEVDTTAIDGLVNLRSDLGEDGIELILARVHKPVLDFLEKSGMLKELGEGNTYPKVLDAVNAFRDKYHIDG